MSKKPRSHARRFVQSAWALLSFQFIASVGAVGVTAWAAFHVQRVTAGIDNSTPLAAEPAPTSAPAVASGAGAAPAPSPAEADVEPQQPAPETQQPAAEPDAPAPRAANKGAAVISVSGEPRVGQSLVAVLGPDPDGAGANRPSLQWLRDGRNIEGAGAATYAVVAADVGHRISVRADYRDGAGFAESVTSAELQPMPLPRRNDGAASLSIRQAALTEQIASALEQLLQQRNSDGQRQRNAVRQSLTAVLGPDPDGVSASPPQYQWLRDGEPIPNAVAANYRTENADAGHAISVRADYVDGEGFRERVTSAPVQIPSVG